jgi:hypothetical protein
MTEEIIIQANSLVSSFASGFPWGQLCWAVLNLFCKVFVGLFRELPDFILESHLLRLAGPDFFMWALHHPYVLLSIGPFDLVSKSRVPPAVARISSMQLSMIHFRGLDATF